MAVVSNPVEITIEGEEPEKDLAKIVERTIIALDRVKRALEYVRHQLEKQEDKK